MKISVCSHRPVLVPCGLDNFHYQVDPYIGCGHQCAYCYVLAQAETDWGQEILIHGDIVGQLGEELQAIPPQTIYMGYYTDPYQPCEADHRQTRKVLALLLSKGFSASILTKSDLVLRDMDILAEMKDAGVSVSVAFNDERTRGRFEAQTCETAKRIHALGRFKDAGLRTGALVCPVIPHITDAVQLIDRLAPHADTIWIYGLSITEPQGPGWRNTRQILARHFPDQSEGIEAAVFSRDHPFWPALRSRLEALKEDRQLRLEIHV